MPSKVENHGAPSTLTRSSPTYMDLTNQQIVQTIITDLQGAYESLGGEFGVSSALPLTIEAPIYGSTNAKFIDFLFPGMAIIICFAHSLVLTAVAFVRERVTATLDRCFASGAKSADLVFGHQMAFLVLLICQITLLLAVAFWGFDVPLRGSLPLLFLLAIILGLAGMSIGMLISSLATSEFAAIQLAFAAFFPTLLLSGILWPVQAIPPYLKWLSLALPTTWTAEAFRDVMIKGFHLGHKSVWSALLISSAWLLIGLALSIRSLRPRIAPSSHKAIAASKSINN